MEEDEKEEEEEEEEEKDEEILPMLNITTIPKGEIKTWDT